MTSATSTSLPTSASERGRRWGGYTLVELFLTVGVLMIVLGLAVNWANRLRQASLEHQTRGRLRRLTAAVEHYRSEHGGHLPDVARLVDPSRPYPSTDVTDSGAEVALQDAARLNGDAVRRALGWPAPTAPALDPIRDPWGTPIVLMPGQNPLIGMAPGDDFFFVSAGPDRRFLTRADNLYSYDYADAAPPAVAGPATTQGAGPTTIPSAVIPGPGGQRE